MHEGGAKPRRPRFPIRRKLRSNSCQSGMRRASGSEVSFNERLSPQLNPRRSTRNVECKSEVHNKRTGQRDCHLSQLSAELSRFVSLCVAALSEVKRPGGGWVSGGGYKYYWSSRPRSHLEGMADRLVPMVTEVAPVSERIMRLSILCGVFSMVSDWSM